LSKDGCGTCSILLLCCAESYSRLVAPSIVPKTTPGLLCRGLLLVWCAKSYSRFVCRELCRELLLVCCAKSYYWFGVPRATPELCRDERQPIYSRRLASACVSRTQLPRCDRSANQSAQWHTKHKNKCNTFALMLQHICRSSGAPTAIHNRASSSLRIWVVPAAWDAHPKIVGYSRFVAPIIVPRATPGITQTIKIGMA
jgi:hypothetical protein